METETYVRDLSVTPIGAHEKPNAEPNTRGEHMRCQGRHCSIHSDWMKVPSHPPVLTRVR